MIDFSKLSSVSDTFHGDKPKVTADSVQVVEESPLDKIDTREKVVDSTPKVKTKVVILDHAGIREIATMSRDARRQFLARLTDSQRRRVLAQLTKIKDSGFSERLGYSLLDSLLANAVFDPSKFNIDSLKRFVDTQEYVVFDDNINVLINKVLDGSFDANADQALVMELAKLLGDQHSRLADTVTVTGQEPADTPEPTPESTPEPPVEDSIDFAVQDPTQNVLDQLHDLADSLAHKFLHKELSTSKLVDSAESDIAKFVLQGFDFTKVYDSYWSEFDKAFDEQFKSISEFDTLAEDQKQFESRFGMSMQEALESRDIADSIKHILDEAESNLNLVADSPLIPENPDMAYTESVSPVGEVLSKALQSYIGGEPEKLEALLAQEIQIPEADAEADAEPVPDQIPEEPTPESTEEPTPTEDSAPQPSLPSWATDAARAFKEGKLTKQIIDCCEDVPFFSQYNCLPTEYMQCCEECEPVQAPICPMSHDEYCTVCSQDIPEWILPMVPQSSVLPFTEFTPEKDYITANTAVGPQNYIPLSGSVEDLVELLNGAQSQDYPHILESKCCTTDALLTTLAKCNQLHVCDSHFYKQRISDCSWSFDTCPECVPEPQRESFVNGGLATYGEHPELDNSCIILVYGVPYTFVPNM